MNQDNLIKNLAESLKPVKVFKFTKTHMILSFLSGLFSILIGLSISGIREDIFFRLRTASFYLELLLLLLLAICTTSLVFIISIPSRFPKKVYNYIIGLSLTWFGLYIYQCLTHSDLKIGFGIYCGLQIGLSALIPAFFIFYFANKAAPLFKNLIGLLTLLAAASYGAITSQLTCATDHPAHMLFWHLIPTFLITFAGYYLGRFFLK